LAACEQPENIMKFHVGDTEYPLPQTGQMWLEDMLLRDDTLPGLCCLTTSYRHEPHPIPGRHNIMFPLFEFEHVGGEEELRELLVDLVKHLGFKQEPVILAYEDACKELGVKEIEAEQENELAKRYGSVIFLVDFPERSSPFFNMKRKGQGLAAKIDVLLHGNETFGTAERSCDCKSMRETFHTISDGEYAAQLYSKFGQERVDRELDIFLSHKMRPRFGGGVGVTRLITAMKKEGIL
jgi:aspartyl/asparaginyl-tRNA synthetase